jgi:hypothetical protein
MRLTELDLDRELSFEEILHFFSMTGEFLVKKYDENGTYFIGLSNQFSTFIYKPTLQTLIRDIAELGYNKGRGYKSIV